MTIFKIGYTFSLVNDSSLRSFLRRLHVGSYSDQMPSPVQTDHSSADASIPEVWKNFCYKNGRDFHIQEVVKIW